MPRNLLGLFLLASLLAGCGTYVPNIQEIGNDSEGQNLVKAIVGSVNCGLRNAVAKIYDNDEKDAKSNNGVHYAKYLDNWGVQLALTLQIEEKSSVSPSTNWMPLGIFSIGASGNLSADATRIDIMSTFFKVSELRSYGACPEQWVAQPHPPGSLLIGNNLKIDQWLSDQVFLASLGQIGVPRGPNTILRQNALTHEIKFEVISGASLNPGVSIRTFTLDSPGPLFATSRGRTHDLLLTFGPLDPTLKDTLAPTALGSFFSSQLGGALSSTALRALTR